MTRRGEVWWVRLDPALGSEIAETRPCLILSTNVVNERRRTVVVVPLSSSPAHPCWFRCSPRGEQLWPCGGEVTAGDMEVVEMGVRRILELG